MDNCASRKIVERKTKTCSKDNPARVPRARGHCLGALKCATYGSLVPWYHQILYATATETIATATETITGEDGEGGGTNYRYQHLEHCAWVA